MLESLNPQKVFYYFEQISKIPRKTKKEKQICDYLLDFAIKHEYKYHTDIYNNIIIYKKGTEGHETNEPVILQAHVDMVAAMDDGMFHDFNTDPLNLIVEDGFIKANGTTLGADDGIGVAMMLAILDSDELEHPPLECVFTTGEEEDMNGAIKINTDKLKAKTMLNLDCENDKQIVVGGAGGIELSIILPMNYTTVNGIMFRVSFNDLASGHSGFDIIKERANAIKLIGRLLNYLHQRIHFSIEYVKGGSEDSVIPNFAYIDFVIAPNDRDAFVYAINTFNLIVKNEYKHSEPNINITFEYKGEANDIKVLDKTSQKNLRFYLLQVPNGIRKMSRHILGLVQTSLNIGTVRLNENELVTTHLIRSINSSESIATYDALSVLAEFLGGFIKVNGEIPAFNGDPNSYLINLIKPLYIEVYDREPEITSMHGMLECGIFSNKIKNLEVVSIGPNIYDAHSPNERLEIASVEKTWEFLLSILRKL